MKCELIIKGFPDKQDFYNHCFQSELCKRWHDGTLHAVYHSKQYARQDAADLKRHFSNLKTTIGTDFRGWVLIE